MSNRNQIMDKEVKSELAVFKSQGKTVSTIKDETIEEKKKLFNAIQNCDIRLNDIVGQTIEVKDVYIREYEKKDLDENGNPRIGHTTILFDKDGKTYVTASNYFFNAIAQILGVVRTLDQPIKIKIVKKPTKTGTQSLSAQWV